MKKKTNLVEFMNQQQCVVTINIRERMNIKVLEIIVFNQKKGNKTYSNSVSCFHLFHHRILFSIDRSGGFSCIPRGKVNSVK